MLLEETVGREGFVALAARAIGTGFLLPGHDVAVLRRLTGLEDGKTKQDPGAVEIAQFCARKLPKLVQLGVVERRP
jgi:hypothetical protein